jgi:soluble lytic murein transglycosylase
LTRGGSGRDFAPDPCGKGFPILERNPRIARGGVRFRLLAGALVLVLLFTGRAAAELAPGDLKSARDVLAAVEKKDYAKAKALADELKDPLQKKALQWHLGQMKEIPYGFAELSAIWRATRGWPYGVRIAERVEDVIGNPDPDDAVIAWFEQSPPRTLKGWTAYILSLTRAGKASEAAEAAQRAWATHAMSIADEATFLRRFSQHIRPDDDRLRILMLLRQRKTQQAQALWSRAILPAEDKAAVALRIVMQRRGAAPAEIEALVAKLPAAIRDAVDFRFDQLSWNRRAERWEPAAKLLENPPNEEDDSRRWRNEANRVIRELVDDGKADLAYRAAAGFADATGETWATMEFLAGWIAFRKLNKPAEALAHFQRLFEKSAGSITRARGAYWAARAAAALNDKVGEQRWLVQAAGYPQVFYGQLAIAALGRERLHLPADQYADDTARKALADEDQARAALLFTALDEPEAAHVLMVDLAMDAADAVRWAAVADFAANTAKRREAAVRAARRASVRNVALFELGFPTIALPPESKVEAAFALAIVRQESEFNLAAVSRAGARGLMQLMPATARQTAQQLKLKYDLAKLTTDEAYNLRLGTEFLHRMTERYGGLYALAAAAYNGGPGNLNKWLTKYGDPRNGKVDLIDFIESIPFEETRAYVMRVMENLTIYRHRAGLRSLAREPGALWRRLEGDALKLEAEPPPEP